jgi:cysteine synthase A
MKTSNYRSMANAKGDDKCPAGRISALYLSGSTVLSGGKSGSHKCEDCGAGFVVPLWHPAIAGEIRTVSTEEAMVTARQLARTEALFAGTSTGANLAAAIEVGKRLGPGRQPSL